MNSTEPNPATANLIGYARVSTDDQDTSLQEEALKAAGCGKIFSEHASGGRWDRPQLQALLAYIRPRDTIVVHRLDRLSRNLKDLVTLFERIDKAGVKFRSLSESIDTATPAGRAMLHMAGVFAEFERSLIRERTMAGIRRAKAQGKQLGRRPGLTTDQRGEIVRLVTTGQRTQAECARLFRVDPATICRTINADRQKP